MVWQQLLYKVPVDLWDHINENEDRCHISTLDTEVFCWDPEIFVINNKPMTEFPYNRVKSDFCLFDRGDDKAGHNLELAKEGLRKFTVSTRPNPFYKPGKINLDEAERLTDFIYLGNGKFDDFIRFGQYGIERFPKIAEELVCVDVRHDDVSPGLIKGEFHGKKYEGRIDLKRFQNAVSKRFYSLMKKFAIERSAVSINEGGLTAEQIKEILELVDPLNIAL